ncbi:hypothetical protein [Ovoidimarina sediminis]|uniref:hypothetical protein n=1 Tax=Ovoidimarina sediminis TaxID=3079856 RepID=UPI002909BC1E|nr:hypothetical protein [Rhodophyticola sp. MJ-SS7]MDU8945766.1 hypothetical protein [Rhodophyticola sp. MJ-SS7]
MSTSNKKFNTLAKRKAPAPFSLRLTFEERAKLEEAANGLPLGAYIKAKLFGEDLEKVRRRNTRPVEDHVALARVLAALGQTRLSSNLNQLARAVNTGTLPVHPDIEAEISAACREIVEMRTELMRALGKSGSAP